MLEFNNVVLQLCSRVCLVLVSGGCFQVKTLDGMSYTVIYQSCVEMGLDLMSAV